MMGTAAKRRRLLNGDANTAPKQDTVPSERAPQFHHFHLLLLQSLYDTDSNNATCAKKKKKSDDDSSVGSLTSDGLSAVMENDTVDNKMWTKARKFVQERDDLIKLKQEACRFANVHQEALDYMEEQGSGSLVPSTPSAKKWRGWAEVDSPLNRSAASRKSLCFFTPQQTAGAELPVASGIKKAPSTCFGLVATLLQNRRQSFNASVHRQSNPYTPLLHDIEEKMDALKGKLERLQENTLEKQKQKVDDLLSRALLSSPNDLGVDDQDEEMNHDAEFDTKSFVSKIETKLQLWDMLACDLKDIIVPQSP